MKPSHLVTPRTLNECNFVPGYGRATPEPRYSTGDKAVMWASAIAAIVCILVVAFAPEVRP